MYFKHFWNSLRLKGLKKGSLVSMARTIKEDKCEESDLNTSLLNISPK